MYKLKMNNLSNTDESYDLGDHPSLSSVDQNDQSATETTEYSPMSGDSFGHCRTNSELSAFSEPTDESSFSNQSSPSLWPVMKPVPCVPPGGLSEKSSKHLRNKHDCANQIHKAAMAINSSILAEMEIPDSYMAALPKSGKASLGDSMYRYMYHADKFSPDHLLNQLNLTSEHEALELADRVEASMYLWRRKSCMSHSKSSWDMVKDLMAETDRSDKNHMLAGRAESLLFGLKQRYPELSQTSLDTCKIQYNKDVGQAILESYSRVLEGLAFNIVAWTEDVIYADRSMRSQE